VITFVFYFALGIAAAGGQTAATPQPHAQDQQSAHTKLSATQVSKLRASAEAGDASAQFNLGRAYEDGNGVPKNDDSAVKWYRKAADQGNAEAENRLGVMYRTGLGVNRDKEEAVRWYHKAAKQGNAQAMFNLGASYYNGDGVPSDPNLAYAWFLLAQDAGSSAADDAAKRSSEEGGRLGTQDALRQVAAMYEEGNELPKDSAEALKWYRKAADAGDAHSAISAANLLLGGGRTLTQEEYAEIHRRCEDAASQKYGPGAYCMGLIYRRGLGVAKDPVESAKWLARAADLGHARAVLELGEAYWKGDGVRPDPVVAYMWIWLACSSKVPGADQDESALRQEMSAKQVEHAKQKAYDWSKNHPIVPGLRKRPTDGSSPSK
jgi:TPR repeat protein